MTIAESVAYLRRQYTSFGQKEIWDTDRRGNDFCEMVYPNEKQPNFPITVTLNEDGCLISVGQIPNVTGDRPITVDQAISAIDDIISDKIVFTLCYADDKDIGSGAPYFTRVFALTGEGDDMSGELERFKQKISKPVKGFMRKLTALKGRFEFVSFTGKHNQTIFR